MNVVGCLRVKDGEKYVERWIRDMSQFCTSLCVLDDGSTDRTPEILRAAAKNHPSLFLHFQKGLPRDGGRDCNILYDMAGALGADWIFAPDVDEFIDPEDFNLVKSLFDIPEDCDDIQGWTFPFFYLWDDEKHYRADGDYAKCHVIRLFKFNPDLHPPRRATHSQLCPDELDRRRIRTADVRMVHYGYMDKADREAKFKYYTDRDPDPIAAGGGVKHYRHILGEDADILPYPSRSEWVEKQSALGTIHSMPVRLQIGNYDLIPGFEPISLQTDVPNIADNVYIRRVEANTDLATVLKEAFNVLRSDGRIDIRLPDVEALAKKFVDAQDDAVRVEINDAMQGGLWESILGRSLNAVGFHRVERIKECDGLHMIAFKPDGQEKKD